MFTNKRIFVLGMGSSGIAVSKLLCPHNHVLVTDLKKQNSEVVDELKDLGINVIITENQDELLDEKFDYVIKNPAIFPDNKTLLKAKQLGIPIINELEVAYKFLPKNVKIVGITGSNGKTTTTYLTYEILKLADLPVKIGGNMRIPLSSIVNDVKENDILALEISSHQLLDLYDFKTDISVLTNLSNVHLDLFKTYENYKNNKLKIFNHHTKEDKAILNKNDEIVSLTKNIPSQKLYFSRFDDADCYITNNKIYYNNSEVCDLNDIRLKGSHNYENVMCAIMVAKEFNVDNEIIKEALDNFSGVEHRLEFVRRINEVEFYNDSKATNIESTIVALSSFDSPIILLLGGLDRNQEFDQLDEHMNNVKSVVCYGQTKLKIKGYCDTKNINVTAVDNLEEAVKLAYNIAETGDTVLLSPACASFDQFESFEERGELFKKTVENL